MNKTEEILRVALQELADDGNEKAKFALTMAARLGGPDGGQRTRAVNELKSANNRLQEALSVNDIEWSRKTDDRINDAQRNIVNAIAILGE